MQQNYTKAIRVTAGILDAWLPRKIAYDRTTGLAVGIVYRGKLVYQNGFGYADSAAGIPMTAKHAFRIASISKFFTAVAILQLAEKGALRLDDRVSVHVPWFRGKVKNIDASSVTIRQLLSHTAGVFRDGTTHHWEDDSFPDEAALRKSVCAKTLVFENLTRFKYSNFGYAILGQVIAATSGMPYETYMANHIIAPLGMTRTVPDFSVACEKWLARGHARSIPYEKEQPDTFRNIPTKSYAPATGFLSNVPDLAKFLDGLSLCRTSALLTKESKKEMIRPHWETGDEGHSYCLGCELYSVSNRRIVSHGGGFPGFITHIALDAENDIGVITLTNAMDSACGAINTGIFETIYALCDELETNEKKNVIVRPERYEGAYRSRWGDSIVVHLGASLLLCDAQSRSPFKWGTLLRPLGIKNRFRMETSSNFSSCGEEAIFLFRRNTTKASTLVCGAHPSERIS